MTLIVISNIIALRTPYITVPIVTDKKWKFIYGKSFCKKKGKKFYARFYIEDESGRKVQKEFVGTESKSETEALLRKAISDYEKQKFVAKSENITVGMLLDLWVEEKPKPGNLSNSTVMSYQGTVNRIKQHPIGNRKLKTVTAADYLQAYIDFLSFGGTNPDGTTAKTLSNGYFRLFSAVLQGAFRFAVFPKRLITFNPTQYVVCEEKRRIRTVLRRGRRNCFHTNAQLRTVSEVRGLPEKEKTILHFYLYIYPITQSCVLERSVV